MLAAAEHRSKVLGGSIKGWMERTLRKLQDTLRLTSPQELAPEIAPRRCAAAGRVV